jgi:hypothetical protein
VRRHRQSTEEILSALTAVETSWRDPHSESVIGVIRSIPDREWYGAGDVQAMLATDFEAGLTAVRLLLDLSKDEFEPALRKQLGAGGIGIKRFVSQPGEFVQALVDLGAAEAIRAMHSRPTTWRDILVERLKGGRGSAIKGQARGRSLEDFAEIIVRRVFGGAFDARCRFVGAKGTSTEKADFAIPVQGRSGDSDRGQGVRCHRQQTDGRAR